jgi:hypothetical protein
MYNLKILKIFREGGSIFQPPQKGGLNYSGGGDSNTGGLNFRIYGICMYFMYVPI